MRGAARPGPRPASTGGARCCSDGHAGSWAPPTRWSAAPPPRRAADHREPERAGGEPDDRRERLYRFAGPHPTPSGPPSSGEAAHPEARELGYEIVHPLTTEPWGHRRFFVRAPDGNVINIGFHCE
ncbi:VOC family protein [Streptomyces sp. NPDC055808]